MKNEKMLHAIGQIDDDLIEAAVIQASKKKQPFYRRPAFASAAAIAACLVLVFGIAFSLPTVSNGDNEAPKPGPIDPGTLLPPSVQEEGQRISINGLAQLNYYAALRMIAKAPKPANQSMIDGNYGITLLTSIVDTDKKEEPPVPEITVPEETQGPPVLPDSPTPPDTEENIYYYALDPNDPFYINKVSLFQIELTDEKGFLASKLGLGVVDVVITWDCIWGDSLITFRNNEKFFSCLTNGGGSGHWEFSTHKYVEGFHVVKNFKQENYAFYIHIDAEGQTIAFNCHGFLNGDDRADQDVKVVSSTVISTESSSFTVAELEEYFNAGKLPENIGLSTVM